MRILLAEDNEMNVEFFLAALRDAAYEVSVARDGLAARDLALSEPFDVMVLDLQMPKLDGYSLCRDLRAAGITRPIVALTAAAMEADVARGREAGFDEYLTKPASVSELRATLRRLAPPTGGGP